MTKRVLIPLVDGFEELEALAPVDLLRRSGAEVLVAHHGPDLVKGSRGVTVRAEVPIEKAVSQHYDAVVLPGGPGTPNLELLPGLGGLIRRHLEEGKLVAAICAAPGVLARMGLLKKRRACCFPSTEEALRSGGAILEFNPVTVDGNIITARGAGVATPFALALVGYLYGQEAAGELARRICFPTP